MSSEVVSQELKKSAFDAVLKRFAERREADNVLADRVRQCMKHMAEICKTICDMPEAENLSCTVKSDSIVVKADDRSLTFLAASGFGSDARLQHPRGMSCAQILMFAHIGGQAEGKLVDTFRVYADGVCSDGVETWTIDGDYTGFVKFMALTIKNNLLDCDLFWPSFEDLPGFVRTISIKDDHVDAEAARHNCVGFECAYTPAKPR